jgi:hypothetical protein
MSGATNGNNGTSAEENTQMDGSAKCRLCEAALTNDELKTCAECIRNAIALLDDLADTYALLPETLGHPATQQYDRGRAGKDDVTVPGGTALVLLGPGSEGTKRRRLTTAEQATGAEGREHAADNRPTDPPSVHTELDRWADLWANSVGLASQPTTFTDTVAFLRFNTPWAAQRFDGFTDYVADLRQLRTQLRIATATNDQPLRGAARCLDCDVRLERTNVHAQPCRTDHGPADCAYDARGLRVCGPYGPHMHGHAPCTCDRGGVVDIWHCPRCRRTYQPATYMLAVRAQIEQGGGRPRHLRALPAKRSRTENATSTHDPKTGLAMPRREGA